MEIKKFYTIAEVEGAFAHFESLAKNAFSSDDAIIDTISEFFYQAGYVRTPYLTYPDLLFRSRAVDVASIDLAEKEFARVRDLSYANSDVIHHVGQGRCNNPKEAVFYGANDNGCPILEVHPKQGNYIVLATFRNKQRDIKVEVLAPIVGVKKIVENFKKGNYGEGWVRMLQDDFTFITEHPHLTKIDDMVSDLFLKPVDDTCKHYYRLTTIIYKIMTEYIEHIKHDKSRIKVDGLIYPSVAAQATGVNYALKTSYIDDKLDFFEALIYYYKRDVGGCMELYMLKGAREVEITDGDNLIWKPVSSDTKPYLLCQGAFPKDFPALFSK